jgi:ABC-type branched-subunit amino acid transport system permease subunit
MGLKLHNEIGWIVSHAWSFRFLVLAMVLSGAEAVLPCSWITRRCRAVIFALLTFLVVALAMVSRIVVQQRPPQ